ncbi:hypothetical protein CAFE_03170 [Caprobacter fermentans]|uniref:Uncharacterized protein n=1 Tax=Caproicibacter fermentans TaxID=2576756 RepID=A0A6N8HVM9_9FIRM|nr:hypothetical protein [Caproicibacter fermentans]MVB09655.1 hypothetical protein [Caproicibacter fermentans]
MESKIVMEKERVMRNIIPRHYAGYREVKIEKTLFRVTSIFKEKCDLKKNLMDWALNKTVKKP